MQGKVTNLCIRCGSERIFSKTWEEKIQTFSGVSVAVHTLMVCPDPECQKIVEEQLAAQRAKHEIIRQNREARILDNKRKAEEKKQAKNH
ncbi:MAG: hypothetical protein Q8P89_05035 [bacterium]|nr:hypothetical protein [bacterium]